MTFDAYVINYGSDAKALEAFGEFKGTSSVALTGFAEGTAIAVMDGFGCRVFAHFGVFYIEISFNNYPEPSQSLDDAALFLGVYRKKITGV